MSEQPPFNPDEDFHLGGLGPDNLADPSKEGGGHEPFKELLEKRRRGKSWHPPSSRQETSDESEDSAGKLGKGKDWYDPSSDDIVMDGFDPDAQKNDSQEQNLPESGESEFDFVAPPDRVPNFGNRGHSDLGDKVRELSGKKDDVLSGLREHAKNVVSEVSRKIYNHTHKTSFIDEDGSLKVKGNYDVDDGVNSISFDDGETIGPQAARVLEREYNREYSNRLQQVSNWVKDKVEDIRESAGNFASDARDWVEDRFSPRNPLYDFDDLDDDALPPIESKTGKKDSALDRFRKGSRQAVYVIATGINNIVYDLSYRLPTRESVRDAFAERTDQLKTKMDGIKVFGKPLSEFLVGTGAGFVAKSVSKAVLGGLGGAVVGIGGGSLTASTKAWLTEVRGITKNNESAPTLAFLRRDVSADVKKKYWQNMGRVAKATMRGALIGAFGGLIGSAASEAVGSLFHNVDLTQVKLPDAGKIATQVPPDVKHFGDEVWNGVTKFHDQITNPQGGSVLGSPEAVKPNIFTVDKPTLWGSVREYAEKTLGRPVSNEEVRRLTAAVIKENKISNPGFMAQGTPLNGGGEVANYINNIKAVDSLIDTRAAIKMRTGSTVWGEAKTLLANRLGHAPTNAQVLELTGKICEKNGIIGAGNGSGSLLANNVPDGYVLRIDGLDSTIDSIAAQ